MAPTRRAGRAAAVLLAAAAVVYALTGCSSGPASGPAQPPKTPKFPAARKAPPTPRHGAYFGAWVRQGPFTQPAQIAALDTLQGALGRRLDIVHTYLKWEATFPTESVRTALGQGSMLLLSWAGTNSEAVASGRYDSVIRQRALEIKATGKPIFLEWRWEMDRPNLTSLVGTPAEFIAAWRHIRAIFAQERVNNVAWVWCPTAKGFQAGGDAAAFYPGDSEVDWTCADVYPGPGPYRSFSDAAGPFLSWASHHRKPVMIGEYGVPERYGPLLRAQWLRAAAHSAQADPQIKAMVYFDSDPVGALPGNSFALPYGTAPMQAFQAIANRPYFNPRGRR